MKNKKGISPLIATVLLIGFVIVLGAVFFKWGGDLMRSSTEESQKKLDLDSACNKLTNLDVEYREVTDTSGTVTSVLLIDNKNEKGINGIILRAYDSAGLGISTPITDAMSCDAAFNDAGAEVIAPFEAYSCTLTYVTNVAKIGVIPGVDVDGDGKEDGKCSQEVTVNL